MEDKWIKISEGIPKPGFYIVVKQAGLLNPYQSIVRVVKNFWIDQAPEYITHYQPRPPFPNE